MGVQEWGIIAGLFVAMATLLLPWMFMVHAKLAVISAAVERLCEAEEKRAPRCIEHMGRLHDLERRVSALET